MQKREREQLGQCRRRCVALFRFNCDSSRSICQCLSILANTPFLLILLHITVILCSVCGVILHLKTFFQGQAATNLFHSHITHKIHIIYTTFPLYLPILAYSSHFRFLSLSLPPLPYPSITASTNQLKQATIAHFYIL